MKSILCFIAVFLITGFLYAGDGQIDIAFLPYTITQSGSYIVTANLSLSTTDADGIIISVDNVTLDLNGHTLKGPGKTVGTSGSAIFVSGIRYNVTVRNGVIRDWRGDGVGLSTCRNSQFEALQCYNNGGNGITVGDTSTVTGNNCRGNGSDGIHTDMGSTISGNTCRGNSGDGIYAHFGSTVSGNTCYNNTECGIFAYTGSTVNDNTCYGNISDGIKVIANCRVSNNNCITNGSAAGDGAGIHATSTSNQIINNHCVGNDRGLDLDSANNVASGNVLQQNTVPVDAVANNQLDIFISELPYTISQPGMYRLSGTLSLATQDVNGITITAENVTLDLNGQSLIGPGKTAGTTGSGIYIGGVNRHNFTIHNGIIRDWRLDGVNASEAHNVQIEALHCYNNGDDGMSVGIQCLIKDNTCTYNGDMGIDAAGGYISGNTCSNNGGSGISGNIGSTIINNTCNFNELAGILGSFNGIVSGNTCSGNTLDGIKVYSGSTTRGNTCSDNDGDGIEVGHNCMIIENACFYNGVGTPEGAGINVTESDNSIEHNLVTHNDRGIDCNPATGNYIASNRASGNTTNYDIIGGNQQGTGDLANVSF